MLTVTIALKMKGSDIHNIMTTIYHTADIHFKDDRREEYKEIIDDFVSDVKDDKTSNKKLVVIAGDIFDKKTTVTANNIDDCVYLLGELTKEETGVQGVIIIMGNHDTNLNNPVYDLISPFTKILNNDKIFYYPKSGSYKHGNIVFNVLSPVDAEPVYPHDPKGKYNVLLFHDLFNGFVHNGTTMKSKIKTEMMKKYDAVMAGHIHDYSVVGKNGAYSGALVQQNIGETFIKGYVKWTFPKEKAKPTHKFVPIYNRYGSIKIKIDVKKIKINDGGIDGKLPTNPKRLVIETKNVSQEFLESQLAKLSKKCKTKPEVVSKTAMKIHKDVDISEVTAQSKLLEQMLERKGVDDDVKEKILDLHKSQEQKQQKQKNNIEILSLEWNNLFCYADNNIIDFTKLDGSISGIVSPNKTGKSSVIDVLVFALYGKTLRGNNKDIINKHSKDSSIKIVFKINSDVHEIIRMQDHHKNNKISHKINGKLCTEKSVDEMYRNIETLIGNYDDFVSSVVLTQDRQNDFVYMSPIKRTQYLSKLLGLDVMEDNLKALKAEKNIVRKQLGDFNTTKSDKELTGEIESVNEAIKKARDDVKTNHQFIKSHKVMPTKPNNSSKKIKEEIATLKKKLAKFGKKRCRLTELNAKLKKLRESFPKKPTKEERENADEECDDNSDESMEELIKEKEKLRDDVPERPTQEEREMADEDDTASDDKANMDELTKERDELKSLVSVLTKDEALKNVKKYKTSLPKPSITSKELTDIISDCHERLADMKLKYKSSLEKYHEYDTINVKKAKYDISINNDVKELSQKITKTRKTSVIKQLLDSHDKIDVIESRIEKTKETSKLTIGDKLKSKIKYNDECECCSSNHALINSIQRSKDELDKLIEEKMTVSGLLEELATSQKTAKIEEEISELSGKRTYPDMDNELLKILIDKHEQICENKQLCDSIAKIEKKLQDTTKEQCVAIYYESKEVLSSYEKLDAVNQKIARLKRINCKKKVKTYDEYREKLNSVNQKIDLVKKIECKKITAEYDEHLTKIKELEEELTEAKKQNSATQRLTELEEELTKTIEEEKQYATDKDMFDEIELKHASINELNAKISELSIKLKDLETELENYKLNETLRERYQLLDIYCKCLDYRTGIPATVLANATKFITQVSNRILADMECQFSICFEEAGTSLVPRICVKDKDQIIPLELCSGYQLMIISIALRHTFIQISNNSLPNFIIIDEGFGCLDEDNMTRFTKLLPSFKTIYSFVLIISHVGMIQSCIETPISIDTNYKRGEHTYSQLSFGISTLNQTHASNLSDVKDKSAKPDSKFKCELCGTSFRSDKMLAKHYKTKKHQTKEAKHNKIVKVETDEEATN